MSKLKFPVVDSLAFLSKTFYLGFFCPLLLPIVSFNFFCLKTNCFNNNKNFVLFLIILEFNNLGDLQKIDIKNFH